MAQALPFGNVNKQFRSPTCRDDDCRQRPQVSYRDVQEHRRLVISEASSGTPGYSATCVSRSLLFYRDTSFGKKLTVTAVVCTGACQLAFPVYHQGVCSTPQTYTSD